MDEIQRNQGVRPRSIRPIPLLDLQGGNRSAAYCRSLQLPRRGNLDAATPFWQVIVQLPREHMAAACEEVLQDEWPDQGNRADGRNPPMQLESLTRGLDVLFRFSMHRILPDIQFVPSFHARCSDF